MARTFILFCQRTSSFHDSSFSHLMRMQETEQSGEISLCSSPKVTQRQNDSTAFSTPSSLTNLDCLSFLMSVNRFFTKNVIFLWGIYQCGRAWKPAPTRDSQRLLLEERLRISGGEVVSQGILNKRCKAATPHPSASLTPSPQGEG